MSESAEEWSVRTWKERHDAGYFPSSEQHRGWKIYDHVPDWLATRVKLGSTVLEVGCGYGQWMIPLAERCRPSLLVGVDVHKEPIERGLTEVAQRGLSHVLFQMTDGLTLSPLLTNAFDVVYSISVMQHLPRSIVRGYMTETNRVLKPGGVALHHFRNADNVGPFPTPATDITAGHTGDFSVGWTAAEVLEAGIMAGWKGVEVLDLGLFLVLVGEKK